jgi:nitrous oxide reductase accessory protein NosL
MKLNLPFFKKQLPEQPRMMTQIEVEQVHAMLVAIVTGQTPIKFSKLKAGEPNPLQMMAEVFAYILRHPHGKQVAAVIEDLRSKLDQWAKENAHDEAQEKIIDMIQQNYATPPSDIIPPPTNRHGAA